MAKYEKNIIRPILKIIEKHQDFLCQPENLSQLAKLGFMFEKLWYAGRVAYGYDGLIKKTNACENNPKYELGDTIKYNSDENENLIYDAWGMHIEDGTTKPLSYDEFKKIILEGKELSDFEKALRKPYKTFDDWVSVLCNKEYAYTYDSRRSVADHLLCVIGNGYGYSRNTGMVIREASGADQDQDLYGEWENTMFTTEILDVMQKVLDVPECKLALESEKEYIEKIIERKKQEELLEKEKYKDLPELTDAEMEKMSKRLDELIGTLGLEGNKKVGKIEEQKFDYYPICNYSVITMFDENTHTSYIQAGLEICEHIVSNHPKIREDFNQYQIDQRNKMIEFAQNFINKFKNQV